MGKIPENKLTLSQAIYELHERKNKDHESRGYLGCSSVGDPCDRKVWLGFRWAMKKVFSGRMLRLFDTGHREEARVLEELKQIPSIKVVDRDPKNPKNQIEVNLGCHLMGHLDAEVEGLPEAPKTVHIFDVKTIKTSKYSELIKGGFTFFRKSFATYFFQGLLYMHARGRTRAGFLFINKDNDETHLVRFDYDKKEAIKMLERARRIALSTRLPEPIMGGGADWYECKLCDFNDFCWDSQTRKVQQNCRTCEHVRPLEGGTWACAFHEATDLDVEYQKVGCDDYEVNKDLAAQKRQPKRAGINPRRPWKRT